MKLIPGPYYICLGRLIFSSVEHPNLIFDSNLTFFELFVPFQIRLYLSYKNQNLTNKFDGRVTIIVVSLVSLCVTSFFTIFPLLDIPFSFVTEICRFPENPRSIPLIIFFLIPSIIPISAFGFFCDLLTVFIIKRRNKQVSILRIKDLHKLILVKLGDGALV